jgi:hypothetical protein
LLVWESLIAPEKPQAECEDYMMKLSAYVSFGAALFVGNMAVAANFHELTLSQLECQVKNHKQVSSFAYFADVQELAFFDGSGHEVGSFWDMFSAYRNLDDGSVIVGYYSPQETIKPERAALIVYADGSGVVRDAPAQGATLYACRVRSK